MCVAPEAIPSDGFFDVTVWSSRSAGELRGNDEDKRAGGDDINHDFDQIFLALDPIVNADSWTECTNAVQECIDTFPPRWGPCECLGDMVPRLRWSVDGCDGPSWLGNVGILMQCREWTTAGRQRWSLRKDLRPPGHGAQVLSGDRNCRSVHPDGDVRQREGHIGTMISRGRIERDGAPVGDWPLRYQCVCSTSADNFDVVV